MIVFPSAKINLGLSVTRKRNDGYHDLETIFYPVGIEDALEVVPAPADCFTASGISVPGVATDNLCLKALALLRTYALVPPVHIHLHKHIPMGAGLGGGSADAAFLLTLLNRQFGLDLSGEDLEKLAARLGADCPFFIRNRPAFATGRGDIFEDIRLDLSAWKLVVVMPNVHVSTADAFKGIRAGVGAPDIRQIVSLPVKDWKGQLANQFEETVFEKYPLIAELKQELYDEGAVYASMSGSGAAVYAFFSVPVRLRSMEERFRVFYPEARQG